MIIRRTNIYFKDSEFKAALMDISKAGRLLLSDFANFVLYQIIRFRVLFLVFDLNGSHQFGEEAVVVHEVIFQRCQSL